MVSTVFLLDALKPLLETFLETISFFLPPGMSRFLRFALGVFFLLIWATVVAYSFNVIRQFLIEPPPAVAAPLPDNCAAMQEAEGAVEAVKRDVEAVRVDLEAVRRTVERIERALEQKAVSADLEAVRGNVERIEQVVTQTPPSPTGIVLELNCKTCVPDSKPLLLPVTGGP